MPRTERDSRFDELKGEFEAMKARDRATRPHPSQRNPEGFCLGDRVNRYPDIIPSDKPHNGRFVRTRPAVVNGHCYFNGTWINLKYLATQGPLPETVEEFWRVVFDNRITVILMLTRLVEKCKPKCSNYWFGARDDGCHWPLSNGLVVRVVKPEKDVPGTRGELKKRVFEIFEEGKEDEAHRVAHYRYPEWQDGGVPTDSNVFIMLMIIAMGAYRVLVHCSAGVGRTGAVIGACLLEERIKNGVPVERHDPIELVEEMRKSRPGMVQTFEQFELMVNAVSRPRFTLGFTKDFQEKLDASLL